MEIIKIIFIFNSLLLLLYFFGNLFVSNISKSQDAPTVIFFSLLIGWITIILATSLYFTGFKTIHIGWLILLLIALFKKRFRISIHLNIKGKYLIVLLLFANLLLLYTFYNNYELHFSYFRTPFLDFIYYSNLSYSLIHSGYENYNIFNNLLPLKGATPYHYSDLWLNGIVSYVSGIPNIKALELITYPVGYVMLFFGAWGLLNNIKYHKYNFILAFFFLHFSGICKNELFGFSPWMQNVIMFSFDGIIFPKLLPVTLFMLAAVLQYEEQKRIHFRVLLFLTFIVFSYFLATVGIVSLVVMLAAYEMWRSRHLEPYSILLISSFIFIPLFYYLYGVPLANDVSLSMERLTSIQFMKFCIGELISVSLKIVSVYILFIPLLFFIPYRRPPFYFLITSIISCIIIYAIMKKTDDSFQIITNYTVPLLNIALFFFSYKVVSDNTSKSVRYYFMAVLLFHFIFKVYDTNRMKSKIDLTEVAFEKKAIQLLQNKNKIVGVFSKLQNDEYIYKKTHLMIPASYLYSTYSNYQPINLSVLDWDLNSQMDSIVVRSSVYYNYCKQHYYSDQQQLKLKYIDSLGINVLILKNYNFDSLPDLLKNRAIQKFKYKDETVIILD